MRKGREAIGSGGKTSRTKKIHKNYRGQVDNFSFIAFKSQQQTSKI